MFCSKCGQELSESAKFCPKCGTPTGAVQEEKTTVEETKVEDTTVEETKTEETTVEETKVEDTKTEETTTEETEETVAETVNEEAAGDTTVSETVEEAAENTQEAEEKTETTTSTVVTDNNSADYNYGFNPADIPEPTKKSGSKKGLLIGVVVAIVVAVVALVACFALGIFTSPEKMVTKGLNNGKDRFVSQYEVGYNSIQDGFSDLNGDMTFSVEATLGKQAKSLIDEFGSSMGYDLSWLESGKADVAMNVEEDQMGFDIKATLNGQELGSIDAVVDAEAGDVLMTFPGIYDEAALAVEGDFDTQEMIDLLASYSESLATYAEKYPTPKDMDKVTSKYVDILAKHLTSVELTKSKAEITAGDVTAKYNQVEFDLDKKTLIEMSVDLLNTLEEDEELKEMLRPMFEATIEADEYDTFEDYDDFWDSMMEELDSAVDEAEEELENIEADDDENTDLGTVCLYLDNKFNFKGFTFESAETEAVADFYVVEKGSDNAVLFKVVDEYSEVVFEGQGETKGGLLNGSYTLTSDDEELFTVELVDFDKDSYEKNHFMKGHVVLSFGDAITDVMTDDDMEMFALAKYDFSFDTKATSGTIGVDVITGDDSLANLTMTFAMEDVPEIKMPDKTYNVDEMSEEDMLALIKAVKYDTLIDNLKKANVPEELFAPLQTLSDAVASGDDYELYSALSSLFGGGYESYDDYGDYDYEDYDYDAEMAAIAAMSYDDFAEYYRSTYDENATEEDIQYMYDLFQEYYGE